MTETARSDLMRRDVLTPHPGLTTDIGCLVSGMDEVREQLREAVKDLDVESTGRLAFPGAHSIGALVLRYVITICGGSFTTWLITKPNTKGRY